MSHRGGGRRQNRERVFQVQERAWRVAERGASVAGGRRVRGAERWVGSVVQAEMSPHACCDEHFRPSCSP